MPSPELPSIRFNITQHGGNRRAWAQVVASLGGYIVELELRGETVTRARGELLGDGEKGSMILLHPMDDQGVIDEDTVQVFMVRSIVSLLVL